MIYPCIWLEKVSNPLLWRYFSNFLESFENVSVYKIIVHPSLSGGSLRAYESSFFQPKDPTRPVAILGGRLYQILIRRSGRVPRSRSVTIWAQAPSSLYASLCPPLDRALIKRYELDSSALVNQRPRSIIT